MKNKVIHWLMAKPTERQTRILKRIAYCMNIIYGIGAIAGAILIAGKLPGLYHSTDIEQVRQCAVLAGVVVGLGMFSLIMLNPVFEDVVDCIIHYLKKHIGKGKEGSAKSA